jgi:hypothetical protein
MKLTLLLSFVVTGLVATSLTQSASAQSKDNLYLDVHHIGPGKVKFKDVAGAHAKDLATQKKYGAHFLKYWVDEGAGNVYCLVSAPDTQAVVKTHGEAHGLLPDQVYLVQSGTEGALAAGNKFYLDIHHLGAGKVTAKDVAAAHQKDLATQSKYGVNFINYWVNEKNGVVVCLSQAPDTAAIIATHKEAHGLVPDQIEQVQEGH